MEDKLKPSCALCHVQACRTPEKGSRPGFCPHDTYKVVGEKTAAEYRENPQLRRWAEAAACTEAEGYCQWTRVEETMQFASKIGAKKLGIATCIGMIREAEAVSKIFAHRGFEVVSVCCKFSSIDKTDLGLEEENKIRPGTFEPFCNPLGQAEVLNAEETDLNVLVGLCVGHDTLFIQRSQAPVTVLITKDRVLGHNPVAALYTCKTYYRAKLFPPT